MAITSGCIDIHVYIYVPSSNFGAIKGSLVRFVYPFSPRMRFLKLDCLLFSFLVYANNLGTECVS